MSEHGSQYGRKRVADGERQGRRYAFGGVVLLLALGVFGGVWLSLRAMERQALGAALVQDQLTPAGMVRPIAQVTEAVRSMKLVTVEIETRVTATIEHESWRGDVAARVEAPAKLMYGADLSRLKASSVAFSPVARAYIVRIPPPVRVATEVCAEDEAIDVQVGWMRLRSRAGEFYLGLARRSLNERARELALSREQQQMVRDATKQQVEALVRKIVEPGARVSIVFEDGVNR
jgi:hypothetical protein